MLDVVLCLGENGCLFFCMKRGDMDDWVVYEDWVVVEDEVVEDGWLEVGGDDC